MHPEVDFGGSMGFDGGDGTDAPAVVEVVLDGLENEEPFDSVYHAVGSGHRVRVDHLGASFLGAKMVMLSTVSSSVCKSKAFSTTQRTTLGRKIQAKQGIFRPRDKDKIWTVLALRWGWHNPWPMVGRPPAGF
jgi:hypothetical protein